MYRGLYLILIINQCSSYDTDLHPPKVTLPHGGSVIGSFMTSVSGKGILAFRGIPYAEPPVGSRRFQPPKPAKPWRGEIITNKDPNMCVQINPYERNFTVFGDEDCLYLNVYVPQRQDSSSLLPVMLYIHGGGWITGTGNSNVNGPERLLDHDVVLVIGNYRLGALGFLSTGTIDCPGNNGFKDQLLMLKWIRANIESFGGRNNDVTLFGESAGSVSVAYHMYAEPSAGLFQKAIMQSGSIFNNWAIINPSLLPLRAKKLARLMKCPSVNYTEMIACLKTRSASDIILSSKEFAEFDVDPIIVFAGVVEPPHDEAFLTQHPKDILTPPSFNISIIVGGTADEGVIKSGYILNLLYDRFTANFSEIFPIMAGYQYKPTDVRDKIMKRIDQFYFKGIHNWSKENHQNLTNLFSDQRFNFGMDKFLRKRIAATNNIDKTYVYLFNHKGPKSASQLYFHGGPEYYGVCHTDDLPYIFYNDFSRIQGNFNDEIMKSALPEMWANFAKTGNPTPDGSNLPKWLSADKYPIHYAHLGRKQTDDWKLLEMETGLLEERLQFWRNLEKDFNV